MKDRETIVVKRHDSDTEFRRLYPDLLKCGQIDLGRKLSFAETTRVALDFLNWFLDNKIPESWKEEHGLKEKFDVHFIGTKFVICDFKEKLDG